MKNIRIIAMVMLFILLCSCKTDVQGVVAYINGEKIETREFMLIASKKKAEVVSYFTDKYDCEYGDSFWSENFDGESPSKMITEKVMEELVPLKIQQKMAVEYGVLDSCDYSDFLLRLEQENAQRKKKEKNNEVVYGVTEYSEQSFLSDETAKMVIAVKDILKEEKSAKDEELKNYYEKIKEKYYKKLPTGKLTLYIFDFGQEAAATEIMNKAKQGDNISELVKNAGGRVEMLTLDEQSSGKIYDMEYPGLLPLLDEEKEIIGLLEKNDGIYFAEVSEVGEGKYRDFEEVKSNVETMYIEALYNSKIEELIRVADIQFTKEYKSLDFSQI